MIWTTWKKKKLWVIHRHTDAYRTDSKNVKWDIQTEREQSDLISLLLFFKNKENRLCQKERDHWKDQDVGGWTILK
jgi:hypothetical protein